MVFVYRKCSFVKTTFGFSMMQKKVLSRTEYKEQKTAKISVLQVDQ